MIGVVHLIRASNDRAPFTAFLASNRGHSSGVAHELVLLMKGFSSREAAAPLLSMVHDLEPKTIFIPDRGFDLSAYGAAARLLDHERLCFLNSYSVVLADEWLAHLVRALDDRRVGLVGAGGSWESQAEWRRGRMHRWPQQLAGLRRARRDYPRFPNPHIRTNAFMIERVALLEMDLERASDKRTTYLLESGRRSITRRIQGQGLRAVVVARDGRSYDVEDWPASHTFRSGDQENLLVADNQTAHYEAASARGRRRLSRDTWGRRHALALTAPGREVGLS